MQMASQKQASKGLMPWRWMSIETHEARVFTTASDVWSFGIVMWEIFTFGMTPYMTMENDDILRFLEKVRLRTQLYYYVIFLVRILLRYDFRVNDLGNPVMLRPNYIKLWSIVGQNALLTDHHFELFLKTLKRCSWTRVLAISTLM